MERYDIAGDLLPYERLAVAIVRQAVLDWYETKDEMNQYRRGGMAWERERCNLYVIERWFSSDWCNALTYGNGEVLLEMLKKGVRF